MVAQTLAENANRIWLHLLVAARLCTPVAADMSDVRRFPQIDAIGGARFDDGAGGDNEVQRTMLEIVNQLDGFDSRGNIKVGVLPWSNLVSLRPRHPAAVHCFSLATVEY